MKRASSVATVLTLLPASFLLGSCGAIHLGGTASHNPVPSGTLVTSGTISPLNGAQVSGAAAIYDQGNGNFVTRLEGVSFPSGVLDVVTVTSLGTANTQQVVYDNGDANYSFSYSPAGTFTFIEVDIYSPSLNSNVGKASFY